MKIMISVMTMPVGAEYALNPYQTISTVCSNVKPECLKIHGKSAPNSVDKRNDADSG